MRIPRVFHQIWVGPDPLPDRLAAYRQTWADRHPEWKLLLWTEENLPRDLERKEAYELLRRPAERADVIRCELLHRHGGVYVDLDFECLRPIDALLEDVDFFIGYRIRKRVNNAIIGGVPGHPVLAEAVRTITPRTTFGPVDKRGTGPLFWRKLLKRHPEATIFPAAVFYPATGEELEAAYAVHHQARTWQDPVQLGERLAATERKLREARDEVAVLKARCERAEAELAGLKTNV